jgi:hypothetical protein
MIKNEFMNKSRVFFKPKSNIPAFLIKTYDILENPVHSDIISWNKDGTAFIVKNINDFSEKILPKYFKHNNFSSFVRQLNMYDFHKSKQDGKENEFKHKLFRRGQKHLLSEIKRKGAENHSFVNEQMMNGGRNAELNKVKKNANILTEELSNVKNQQGELEKLGKMIYTQNTQLLGENKLLWDELTKNKDKYEKKVEKLMMFIYSVMNQPGNEAISSFANKKMLPNSGKLGFYSQVKAYIDSTDFSKFNLLNQEPSDLSPSSQQKNNTFPLAPDKENERPFPRMSNYFPDKNTESKFDVMLDQMQTKARSPPVFNSPLQSSISGASTLTNTPNVPNMMNTSSLPTMMNTSMMPNGMNNASGPTNMPNTSNMPINSNTYSAQPYFTDNMNMNMNSLPNNNQTATTSGSYIRKENPKLTRPVPSMDISESQEFRENPIKLMKKDPEFFAQTQNFLQNGNLSNSGNDEDPSKFEEWPFGINLSRGGSYNLGDLNLSRLNSFNPPRVLSSADNNFSQMNPMYMQNTRNNGDSIGMGKLESEGLGKNDTAHEEGVPYFSPSAFMKNSNGVNGGYNFGQTSDDPLYNNAV